jgi:hypothetical protein
LQFAFSPYSRIGIGDHRCAFARRMLLGIPLHSVQVGSRQPMHQDNHLQRLFHSDPR